MRRRHRRHSAEAPQKAQCGDATEAPQKAQCGGATEGAGTVVVAPQKAQVRRYAAPQISADLYQ